MYFVMIQACVMRYNVEAHSTSWLESGFRFNTTGEFIDESKPPLPICWFGLPEADIFCV